MGPQALFPSSTKRQFKDHQGPPRGKPRSGGLFGKKKEKYFGRQRGGLGGSGKTKNFTLWKSDNHFFFSGDNQASARHAGNPGDKLEE